jgi:hypothetical protein
MGCDLFKPSIDIAGCRIKTGIKIVEIAGKLKLGAIDIYICWQILILIIQVLII